MNSQPTDYDALAPLYIEDSGRRADREFILVPTARHYLGDICGKAVLDLGCGSGFFTRLIRKWGAGTVVGVDVSRAMIDGAMREERETPIGISYVVASVSEIQLDRTFDVIFAAFLLHYANSVDELRAMCMAVSNHLSNGGLLVSFNENPFCPTHPGIMYDVSVSAPRDIGDGTEVIRTHYSAGQPLFSFRHRHYSPATYERILHEAGFEAVEWLPFVVSPEADRYFPDGYWNAYRKDFSITVLCSRRKIRCGGDSRNGGVF